MTQTKIRPEQINGAGKILQVLMGTYSTQTSNATTTAVDTGLTVSITPSSTSSKIMIFVKTGELKADNASSGLEVTLVRDSTDIAQIALFAGYPTAGSREYSGIPYLDSPATTSEVTYKTTFKRSVGTGTVYHCEASTLSTIVVMEVAG